MVNPFTDHLSEDDPETAGRGASPGLPVSLVNEEWIVILDSQF
jgi:hypothetical protein